MVARAARSHRRRRAHPPAPGGALALARRKIRRSRKGACRRSAFGRARCRHRVGWRRREHSRERERRAARFCRRSLMMRSKTWWLVASLLVSPMACGDGDSTSDATDYCEEQRATLACGFTDAAFEQCVSCREECGDACGVVDTANPCTFVCP